MVGLMTDTAENLPDLPAAEGKTLVIVAHPDDAEYGLSCAVHHWTARGQEVGYLLLTDGEAGIRSLDPEIAGPLRRQEQQEACDAVGAQHLFFAGLPDGHLEANLAMREVIAGFIRRFQPDTVVVSNYDSVAPWGLNQADHRAAGQASLDAIRDADNPWVHRASLGHLEPWKVSRALVFGSHNPTHIQRVNDDDIAAGVASLQAHERYLSELPEHPDPRDVVHRAVGLETEGVEQPSAENSDCAVPFEQIAGL